MEKPNHKLILQGFWGLRQKHLTTTAENAFLPAIHAQEMSLVVPTHRGD